MAESHFTGELDLSKPQPSPASLPCANLPNILAPRNCSCANKLSDVNCIVNLINVPKNKSSSTLYLGRDPIPAARPRNAVLLHKNAEGATNKSSTRSDFPRCSSKSDMF